MDLRISGGLRNLSSEVLVGMIFTNKVLEINEGQVKDVISESPDLKCELVAGL
jgi:hypothetical protein